MRTIVLFCALLVLSAPSAGACGWHGFKVPETLVDRLLGSSQIILARPDPADPYRFTAVEALEGGMRDASIPYLVTSSDRRRLAANPDDAVLFARTGMFVPWKRIGYVAAGYRPLFDRIIARLPAWRAGQDSDRFWIFAAHVDARDLLIRTMALRQLDRAPYQVLRDLELGIDVDRVVEGLSVMSENHLKPIRVLLLGLSKDPRVRAVILSGLDDAAKGGSALAGAYATALIEMDGAPAITGLLGSYLLDAGLPVSAREPLIGALAVQATGGAPALRPAIGAAIDAVLAKAPELAPAVARQFGVVSDWSHRTAMAAILSERRLASIADVIVVSQYVSLANKAYKTAPLGQ